ncbi:hypothetical protein [Acinetobacter colistiniresistens]|uniref:hypothetical protein n=1 Tax=Acinetobacter colistiniresistens TaxID=280145 RepID=UPI001D192D50|nr:hypothetical protein [Acinetobacter colistiniresistens]
MNAINKPNEVSMFKVGDYVVFSDSDTYKNPLLKIVHMPLQKVVIVSTGINGYADFSHLRHATPQEIAAGHRIDLEELRDCDTSPNCKKYNLGVDNNETN